MKRTRKPTIQELKDLLEIELKIKHGNIKDISSLSQHNDKKDEAAVLSNIKEACIAVFDNYVSGPPCEYFGRVMVVVWPHNPSYTSTYTWNSKGEIEHLTPEG